MGNSIKNCFRSKNQETIPILVLGLRGAGKTDVVYRIMSKRRDEFLETNGCRVYPTFKVLKKQLRMTELGGDHFFDIWKYYFLDAMAIIFVVDSSDALMLDRAKQVFSSIFTNDMLTGKPFLILANKKDIRNSVDYLDICDYFNVEHLANLFRTPCLIEECGHFEMDSKILKKSIRWLVKSIEQNYKTIQNKIRFLRLLTTNEGSVIEQEFSHKRPKRAMTGKRKKRIKFSSNRPKSAPVLKFKFSVQKNYLVKPKKRSPDDHRSKSRKHNKVAPMNDEIATSENQFKTIKEIDEPKTPSRSRTPKTPSRSRKLEPKTPTRSKSSMELKIPTRSRKSEPPAPIDPKTPSKSRKPEAPIDPKTPSKPKRPEPPIETKTPLRSRKTEAVLDLKAPSKSRKQETVEVKPRKQESLELKPRKQETLEVKPRKQESLELKTPSKSRKPEQKIETILEPKTPSKTKKQEVILEPKTPIKPKKLEPKTPVKIANGSVKVIKDKDREIKGQKTREYEDVIVEDLSLTAAMD